ncbi:unnamed protein product [Staurois parvus]|uniref:Uncharacterized protein n=1 Tax=Staurois parvus TaxID=386267 RepID=A0ABN9F2K2_9NEOB|nr:unnamed protein product [Staurois parvus]
MLGPREAVLSADHWGPWKPSCLLIVGSRCTQTTRVMNFPCCAHRPPLSELSLLCAQTTRVLNCPCCAHRPRNRVMMNCPYMCTQTTRVMMNCSLLCTQTTHPVMNCPYLYAQTTLVMSCSYCTPRTTLT